MSRYSLKLPHILKQDAEHWASSQGVSLNQFIVWAVAEKVGALKQRLADPRFPHIVYRLGASNWPTPVLRGTGLRVQTVAIAAHQWGMTPTEIAEQHSIKEAQVQEVLEFYEAHRSEIDALMRGEEELERLSA